MFTLISIEIPERVIVENVFVLLPCRKKEKIW